MLQNGLFFNQAKAVKSNINATNGMIFLINTVLDVPEGTVTEILANPSYNISKFLQLVRKAKLDQHYNNRGNISVQVLLLMIDCLMYFPLFVEDLC